MKLTNEQRDMICKEYSEYLVPSSQLAKKYGIAYQNILSILHKNGIPTRKRQECSKMNWNNPEYRDNHKGNRGKTFVKCDRGQPRPDRQGDKHWNWKGGIAKLASSIRTMLEYKNWRRAVFTRDSNTCQQCGLGNHNAKVILQADHIYPFSKILIDNDITTVEQAKVCEQLWDVNNGRVLCKDCHKKTDTYCSKVHSFKK